MINLAFEITSKMLFLAKIYGDSTWYTTLVKLCGTPFIPESRFEKEPRE